MSKSVSKWFILSAGAVLTTTGVAKLLSSFGDSKLLAATDPIIGIEFRHLMLAVGLIEIIAALFCFSRTRSTSVLWGVAWLSTTFLFYRLGMWLMDWKSPCGCMGTLTDALNISPQTADNVMKVILAYLLTGSYFLLFRHWIRGRSTGKQCKIPHTPEPTVDY